jgi:nitroimidazol reductase NimA-like FMN-containing flavoprotein (pyridoxamine 5'-phosphate oxidase superfamily)
MMSQDVAEPRRVRGHISWAGVESRLHATRSMILATTRPDGRPHALPTWFWWDDGRIYFITARTTQKSRNLAAQPWIVAHFGDGDDVLFAEGRIAIITDSQQQQRVDRAYGQKYVDPPSGARASIFDNALDDLYRVDVVRVVTWMYGTVGGWTEWRFGDQA